MNIWIEQNLYFGCSWQTSGRNTLWRVAWHLTGIHGRDGVQWWVAFANTWMF